MRAVVRPHLHFARVIEQMSRVRKRRTGVASLVSDVMTSSPTSPSATALAGFGVDDLGQEVVFVDVEAVLLRALARDAGADDFRQAVDVDGLDAGAPLYLAAHILAPRLGPEYSDLEIGVAEVQLLLFGRLHERQEVGRRAAHGARLEVLDEEYLALGVAGAHGDDRGADGEAAVVRAEPAGEEAVAVCILHYVARLDPRARERPRHHVAPALEIAVGVGDDDGLAGGAGRAVYLAHVLLRASQQAQRIVRPEVVLAGERQPAEVFEALDFRWPHARGVEALAVERHLFIDLGDDRAEPLDLQGVEVLALHALVLLIEYHGNAPLEPILTTLVSGAADPDLSEPQPAGTPAICFASRRRSSSTTLYSRRLPPRFLRYSHLVASPPR